MFDEVAFNTLVTHQGYKQCILMSNTQCEHNFCLFTRKLHRGL